MAAKAKSGSSGLIDDDVTEMATEALFEDLPTKTARHLRNAPRRVEGENVDDYQTIGTWEGRLREKRNPQNQDVGDQEKSVGTYVWVMEPYGMGAQEWRKIRAGDRLVIADAVYSVEGPDSGTSVLLQQIPLGVVEKSGSDAGA